MTDREILLAVRQHCIEGINERRNYGNEDCALKKQAAQTLVGYLVKALRSILDDVDMRTCECGRGPVDAGIMCRTCWVETSDVEVSP